MSKCFVIQPFDGEAFDKRYKEVIVPAIQSAGLEPYRVDEDPTVTVPINSIEAEIRNAAACVADITTDNPNVWYELGYAYASGKDVVLVCSKGREKRPFDIQHKSIVYYASDSPNDFVQLGTNITERLNAIQAKNEQLDAASSLAPTEITEGLTPHEIAVLVVLMEGRSIPESSLVPAKIIRSLEMAGFRAVAATIALETLRQKKMIDTRTAFDPNSDEYAYEVYYLTPPGIAWVVRNQHLLVLRDEQNTGGELVF